MNVANLFELSASGFIHHAFIARVAFIAPSALLLLVFQVSILINTVRRNI